MLQRGQLLFHRRRGLLPRLHLDPRGNVKRLHGGDRGQLVVVTPRQKLRHSAAVSPPRVRVADVRREEFQKRTEARSPLATMSAGRAVDKVIGTSWFTAQLPE